MSAPDPPDPGVCSACAVTCAHSCDVSYPDPPVSGCSKGMVSAEHVVSLPDLPPAVSREDWVKGQRNKTLDTAVIAVTLCMVEVMEYNGLLNLYSQRKEIEEKRETRTSSLILLATVSGRRVEAFGSERLSYPSTPVGEFKDKTSKSPVKPKS
eukprot:superscaffoldBa00000812_g7379